ERGGDGQIWIDVGSGDSVFYALARRRSRYHAQGAGAIFDAPGGVGRSPETRDQSRITVHGRRDHGEKFRQERLLASDEMTHGVGHAARTAAVVECRLAIGT